MCISSPASHNPTAKHSQFRRQFQIAALRFLLNTAFQTLKETPDDVEKETIFETTLFHRFHVHFSKRFLPQLNDETDSDSLINCYFIFSRKIFHWIHFMNTKTLVLKNTRFKSSVYSLKQNAIVSLKLKTPQVTIPAQPLMYISAIAKFGT